MNEKSKSLIERLQGIYRMPITDGLGRVGGSEEPDNEKEFVRKFSGMPPIQKEAAEALELAHAAIDRLTAELSAANARAETAEAESATLRKRVERLEALLKPFAEEANCYDPPDCDDDFVLWATPAYIRIKHLRSARAAIEEPKP